MRFMLLALAILATACSSPSKADVPHPASTASPSPADVSVDAVLAKIDELKAKAAKADAAPKNLVCEAFKGVNDKAVCTPYFTDLGELHVHAAMITLGGQQLHCRYDANMTGVLCTDPIVVKLQPPPATEDKKTADKSEPKKK